PIRFRHAAIRSALALVDVYILNGLVAIVTILVTRNNQRLGDLVAGTIVVRERSGTKAPTAIAFPIPRGCEAYAETLDVSALTQGEYGAIRSFLLRAVALPAHVRAGLATELAAPLVHRMRHTPPTWVGPELFLACVAAVYQRRFGAAPPAAPGWQMPASPAQPASWGVARPTAPPAPDADTSLPLRAEGDQTDAAPPASPPAAPPPARPPTGFEAPD
ncbi:MAG: hypothetical protein QOG03_1886, partial [Actinomycetota bacterium]|nr:hypothetical protein [Actinomycetota bacterium]